MFSRFCGGAHLQAVPSASDKMQYVDLGGEFPTTLMSYAEKPSLDTAFGHTATSLQGANDPGCSESEPRIRRNMKSQLQPWHLLLLILAGWINPRQRDAIFFGQKPLQAAAVSFLAHYHRERNHQGPDNRLIDPGQEVGRIAGEVEWSERLGGILRYYDRKAA
jgi:hypothetical protein